MNIEKDGPEYLDRPVFKLFFFANNVCATKHNHINDKHGDNNFQVAVARRNRHASGNDVVNCENHKENDGVLEQFHKISSLLFIHK
jgi:hypothetical protein